MMKRIVGTTALALILSGGVALAQSAASDQKSSSAIDQQQAASGSSAAGSASSMSASQQAQLTSEQLLDMKVKGAQGEDIGEVEQLVIDPSSGRVQSVVVSVGGFLGMGDKKVALPWNQVQIGQDKETLTTQATKQQLETAQAWQDPSEQTASRPAGSTATGGDSAPASRSTSPGAGGATTAPPAGGGSTSR